MCPERHTEQTTHTAWLCPECGEAAQHVPPTTLLPYAAHGLPAPQWSHLDGEPLCPVTGPDGYRSADAVPASSR